uniref:Polycystic kidney disease 1a n=1 Tax=Scleropages formosus TaxID=113540 RepID=A0A8C9SAB2_SCLFO
MPSGNGQTVSQREHGVCFSGLGLGLLCALLFALCFLAGSADSVGCSPCPANCSCAVLGAPGSCVVNCSNAVLERGPDAAELPSDTDTLWALQSIKTSKGGAHQGNTNSESALEVHQHVVLIYLVCFFICRDLSYNQISTLEERICDNLFNLTEINLSFNPLECNCKLFRLVNWLRERGVRLQQEDATRCDRPLEVRNQPLLNVNVSLHACLNYAACLQDGHTGLKELVIFTKSTPGNFTRETCNTQCFAQGQRYGGLGAHQECLCSTNSLPNDISESQCSAACTDPLVMKRCGWTVALDVFPIDFSAFFRETRRVSVHTEATLAVSSSVPPDTVSWNFSDSTPLFNNTKLFCQHKYALPGKYVPHVTLLSNNKQLSVTGEIQVTLPPILNLSCPEYVVANHSLEIQLANWGGEGVAVDWRILRDGNEVLKAAPHCPAEGTLHGDPPHCYQLVPEECSWAEARRRCAAHGGDLAVVRVESLRNLLAPRVTQERGVWLGLSDVNSPNSLRWVNGSDAAPEEGGARDRATLVPGNICVSLDSGGHVSSHPCSATRAFVCEFKPEVPIPDAKVFMVGTTVFQSQRPLDTTADMLPILDAPIGDVELLMFPAMGFWHEGRLSAVEFVTQDLTVQVQVRFQVYKPDCQDMHLLLPGGEELCFPIAVCQAQEMNTTSVEPCPSWQQWCSFRKQCLPISSPCPPSSYPNCSTVDVLPPEASYPTFSLVHDISFTLPSGTIFYTDFEVFPGDIIALQHDAGPGGLLQCTTEPFSPWRQSFFSLNNSEWLNDTIDINDISYWANWTEDAVCQLRVLYTGKVESSIPGQLLQMGLPNPGVYSFEVTSRDPDFPSQASCSIQVVPPMELAVIYPQSQNGTIYFTTNQTFLLLRIRSWHKASASWQGGNQTIPFELACPSMLASVVEECQSNKHNDMHFAYVDLPQGSSPSATLVLTAHSEVTSSSLTIHVKVEEPLKGLKVLPHPSHRVLMESLVSYSATVEGGSNPSFKWTVDDKPYFTYYNTVLNVIYQNAAVYKLTVTAQNHVSKLTEHFNVTVDRMNPMGNVVVEGVPPIITQGSAVTLSVSVAVDMSVDATIRWSFGDGGYQVYHFKPPYDSSLLLPDPSVKMVTLQHNVTYIYSQPGEYILTVSVSNRYENSSQKKEMVVYSVLTNVEIMTESSPMMTGIPLIFEAHPLPSAYGIVYTWDFGDGSAQSQGRRVYHIFSRCGIYNITVFINNTISQLANYTEFLVSEDIQGLEAFTSAPTELNTPTMVRAQVEAGNNITWTFDMGDNQVLTSLEPQVEYTYLKDGNYTVNVTATNEVSAKWVTVQVKVFVLQVLLLEPSGCIQELKNISFNASVSGNSSIYMYEWSFGDGTPNRTIHGTPHITHIFSMSGDYHLSLHLSSKVNKANFFAWICVQPVITNVSLTPLSSYTKLGEESRFVVSTFPEFEYTYLWDFGINNSLIRGENEMAFTYKNPGQYLVMVTVLNNISCSNNTALIEVQESVGLVVIQHNGTKSNSLTLHQPYMFTASSGTTKVCYTWDFGDGSILSGHTVTHIYNRSGHFNISLIGSNKVSRNSSEITVAVITPIQGLTINASLTNVPLNTSVHFEANLEQGDGVNYSWILCDRCTPIPSSRSHTHFYTFKSVGTFNVIVTAENEVSSMQASIFIYVQRELEGLQIVSEELGDECCFATNKVLHLQAVLREGTNMSFSWNLLRDQEAEVNFSGRTIDVSFPTPGPCVIFLKASNRLGQLTINRTVEFLDPVGNLSLSAVPNPVALNTTMNLTVFASGGSNLEYFWFADGTPFGNTPSLEYKFDSPGLKLVRVEVSNDVSFQNISEWISVQEPITGVTFSATDVTEQNFVTSGTTVSLQGYYQTGSNVTWTWNFPNRFETGQIVTYFFSIPGVLSITLNATNDISGEAVTRDFTVQDKITGLELKANKSVVAPREAVEFSIAISTGTSASFVLSISGDSTVFLTNMTYVHQFTRVDNYMVNLTAHNQVSSERVSIMITVMEPITRLTMVNCCEPAIPVGVAKHFSAEIQTGDHVTFLWTFDLHHGAKQSFIAKQVNYTPEEPGQLTIYLRVINILGGQNVTKVIQVQNILTSVTLDAQPQDTFINKLVTFRALVAPQPTPATFQWTFGDGSAKQTTTTPLISHAYLQPGTYLVRVNASNLVSWTSAQVTVHIGVLDCEEPTVQLVQTHRLLIRRSKANLLEASVDLKGCVHYGVQYLWEIFDTPLCSNVQENAKVPLPAEVDVRKLQLSIPKMALRPGNYSTVFSLSYSGVPLRKTACLQLSVVAGKLVPIIEGGTYRVWSKTHDLQLSAEQSYDPNLEPDNQSLLTYLWECLNTSKGPTYCNTLNFGLGANDPVLGIPGSELEADVAYTFRLTIGKEGMSPESTNQTVLVKSGRIPMVSLECVSCKAQSVYEVSQNSYVYLAGSCSNCQASHRGRWTAMTLTNETLVLDAMTTTTGSNGMNLVLRQGALRDRSSYVFSLHVSDDHMDREGVASIVLRSNLPPSGGSCSLQPDVAQLRTLVDKVHFTCTGYMDSDDSETPLLYSLLVMRCLKSQCEEFCVYKGTSPEHTAFLPAGLQGNKYKVDVFVFVEDHQGAAVTALNKSIEVLFPETPPGYVSLAHWLYDLTNTTLRDVLKQGDPQRVRELCLALITVLNEYETRSGTDVTEMERQYRVNARSNITRALTSLDLNTVNDIQQTSAALAQCTAVSREFICEECQNSTLNKLESMLEILQSDTKQGTVTPTEIADNILNIMGGLINLGSQTPPPEPEDKLWSLNELHPLHVAARAYSLSSELMRILMHSRVLNEEALVLRGTEIITTGKRADPQSLLCYQDSPDCPFSIPHAFRSSLGDRTRVVQLLVQVESNPFPFNFVGNYTVSTKVASMEFQTENGTRIPVASLGDSQAITVAVNNSNGVAAPERLLSVATNVSRCSSIIAQIKTGNSNRQAGLHIKLSFSPLDDADEPTEENPFIDAYLHNHPSPNEYNCTQHKRISLHMLGELDHKPYTFFLSPQYYDTTQDYYVNVTKGCSPGSSGVRLEVSVFTSLCQYFSESDRLWRTDGMQPLAETTPSRAVCSTRHLTAFAASLFVPPGAVRFNKPVTPNISVLLTCAVGLLCYSVAAAILHRLDQMDLRRAAVVPLCGKDGLFKYEVQVKTGWSRGAGTTAHVGISLYGQEGRSGHRHLDYSGAFTRNSLDIFQIATESSLGSLWKIRMWHDNKGLSPAWYLQYVLVKDLQTGSSYFFLVEEWLSVDNEQMDGRVEIEVEATAEADLCEIPRLLRWELQRAVSDSHIWISLWDRPTRSPFTRLQRATCCALLLHLVLLANAVWFSTVADRNLDHRAWSESLAVGMVSCFIVYPLYLLALWVFRMARSKVTVEQVPAQVDQESLEIDDFLDNSMAGSSFLILNSLPGETYSEETNVDMATLSKSLNRWGVQERERTATWPDLLNSPVAAGEALPKLKRGQGSRHLGVDMALVPEEEEVGGYGHRSKYFTSSDEDLIKRILVDGQLQVSRFCDAQQFFAQADGEMADLSSIFGDKTEVILLQKLNEPLPTGAVRREPPKTAFTSRAVMTDVCRRRFPAWCGRAALVVSWGVLALSSGLASWLGLGFRDSVVAMWLISAIGSFLASCFILEPLKVRYEGLYFALRVRRLRPEERDELVESPRVEPVSQRVPRVRPPQGFALFQAREEARRVRVLHGLLKNFVLYMLFLLVVLLMNYSNDTGRTFQPRLRSQLERRLLTADYANVSGYCTGRARRQPPAGTASALFVELSLYNTNTDLLAVVTFLLEFPGPRGALSSLDVKTCRLQRLSAGLTLQLLLTIFLLAFVLYFCARKSASIYREGRSYFLQPWNVAGLFSLVLTLATAALHLIRSTLADQQWASFVRQRHTFTDFYVVAFQSQVFSQLSALLLFILVLKASHQLRFLREWAVFGRTLQRSAWELLAGAVVLLVLLLAYSHAGYLLFSTGQDGHGGIHTASLSLLGLGQGLLAWHPVGSGPGDSATALVFHGSFAVLCLLVLWLLTSALLRSYRVSRAELYRPAVEPQDYEMVDLFLRRLKMWMGLSRVKEFRHKVRFEGMELPPSRSSSTSDCKSLCLPPLDPPEVPPTPDSMDASSEVSWRATSCSPCSLAEGGLSAASSSLGAAWRERAEVEATLRRLLPAFDSLLLQLERVTRATEELYRTECRLERFQRRGRARAQDRERGRRQQGRRDSAGWKSHCKAGHKSRSSTSSSRSNKPNPDLAPTPTPISVHAAQRREWDGQGDGESIPSSLFRHPAHTTTIPTRKRKATPLKNKVHPNTDVHVSGHPRP